MRRPPASDGYTRERLAILEAALANASLGHLACRVLGLLLLRYCNRDLYRTSGRLEAWPGQQTLARESGATPDGVRKAVLQLQAAGLVTIHAGRGRGHTTRYELGKSQTEQGVLDRKTQNVPTLSRGQKPDGLAAKSQTRTGTNPLSQEPDWIPEEVRREFCRTGRGPAWATYVLSRCDWCEEDRTLITDAATAKEIQRHGTSCVRLAGVSIEVRTAA
jgi:hypothetical protein